MGESLLGRVGEIRDAFELLVRKHRVPGAALAVSHRGELVDVATGVLNVRTGQPATPDSVFQIGSNTKLLTTTLVMQLVDEGEVDLDAAVVTYLPDFRLKEPGAEHVTIRHLLTHTSGLPGDHFEDYGRGDEATGAYVASLAELPFDHPTGALFSYCNAGFTTAGHVAEVVTGSPFRQLLVERIARPLRLRSLTTALDEMFALPTAVGHVLLDGEIRVHPQPVFGWSSTPAGSMTVATAAELARFAAVLLAGGVAPDGSTRLLSAESAAAMLRHEVDRPLSTDATAMGQGLGWRLETWTGKQAAGHGGATMGQLSFLQTIPGDELVVVLLTNSGSTSFALWDELGNWLFDELAGVRMAGNPPAADPPPDLDLDRYVGTYRRAGVEYEVRADDEGLLLDQHLRTPMARPAEDPSGLRLRPVDPERFLVTLQGRTFTLVFVDFVRGRPRYLHDGRAARRARTRRQRRGA